MSIRRLLASFLSFVALSSGSITLPGCTQAAFAQAKPDVNKGAQLFNRLTCAACHPQGGNTINRSKPLKGASFQQKFARDAMIAAIVRSGMYGTAMPAFGKDQLSDAGLSDIIAYIRSLTPKTPPGTPEHSKPPKARKKSKSK